MAEQQTQECNICGAVHPLDHYYTITQKNGKLYRYKYCRTCHYHKTIEPRKTFKKKYPKRLTKLQSQATRRHLDKQTAGVYLMETTLGLYVGHSSHIKFRISQHKNLTHPHSIVTKGGEVLNWVMLEEIDDYDLRREREKYWIRKLKPALNFRVG